LSLLAARAAIPIFGASVGVTVDFGRDPMDGLYVLTARMRVHLPGVERVVAEELVRNTERFCPYTKMTKQGIASVVSLAEPDDADRS
jgi:organic hydroperoxide reductase OsmC/OhrA